MIRKTLSIENRITSSCHLNDILSSVAIDVIQDGMGQKLEKVGQFFQVLKFCIENIIPVSFTRGILGKSPQSNYFISSVFDPKQPKNLWIVPL